MERGRRSGSGSWLVLASAIAGGVAGCAPREEGLGELGPSGATSWEVSPLSGQPVSRYTRLAMILVRWSGGLVDSFTADNARAALFTDSASVRNTVLESSYGQHDISGDAFGPFQIPAPNGCDTGAIQGAAESAAIAAGVNLATFTNIAVYFPTFGACPFSGDALLGTPASPQRVSWFNGSIKGVPQELGHNFGLFHANSWRCPGAAIAARSACSSKEFGDPFDPMGSGFVRHHNAYEKTVEGWLGGCNVVKVPRTRKVDIVPIEGASNGVQALRVRMSPLLCPTGITSCEYVVEYRQPVGFDGLRGGPNGVYVHVGNVGSFVRSTHLLDMTPATSSMADSALPMGSTFTDPDGIAIKVVAADAAHATIQVTVPGGSGSATCLDGSTY